MKNKIFLLALFGLLFGAKTFGQGSPACLPDIGLTFPAGAEGIVCIWNECVTPEEVYCCYTIPTDGSVLCLTGSGSPYYYPTGGATSPTTASEAESGSSASPCLRVEITNYDNTITDDYLAYWNTTTSRWDVKWDERTYDNHYTVAGFTQPDLSWYTDGNGNLYFYFANGGNLDDENVAMAWNH